ncbi:hypothetical protein KQX54_018295 [Cotesia glomerata]|uniref:Uncharacterized protein n=1 Tax=Cotesia glomerata TaxID=32391 RepID=A0AAV7I5Q0_COTGL|nr:hypothetical protein KQX54_018295 [Cotesia glomerata]
MYYDRYTYTLCPTLHSDPRTIAFRPRDDIVATLGVCLTDPLLFYEFPMPESPFKTHKEGNEYWNEKEVSGGMKEVWARIRCGNLTRAGKAGLEDWRIGHAGCAKKRMKQ